MKYKMFTGLIILFTAAHVFGQAKIDTTGLVAYYPFSGNAVDASGHGHDGVVSGAVLALDRANNAAAAYHFNNSAFIEIPYDSSLYPATSITITAWIKADSWGPSNNSIISTASSFPNIGYGLRCEWGIVRFFFSNAGLWTEVATTAGSVSTGQWHFVTCTYDGAKARLYLNGILSALTTASGSISPAASYARIGSSVNNWEYFNGSIDDIRIYRRALSDQEITALYDEDMAVQRPMLLLPMDNVYLQSHTVPFFWNAVDSAASYRLQVTIDSTFTTMEFDHLIAAPDTNDTASSLIYNNYFWRVRAFNAAGDSSWWSAIRRFTIDTTPPVGPSLISPAHDVVLENRSPLFHWNAATGCVLYHIDIAADSQFTAIIDSVTLTGLYYVPVNQLAVGQRYWWRVSACDPAGNWSIDNQMRRFRIKLVVVPILYAPGDRGVINTNSVHLIWSEQDSATSYQMQASADSTFMGYEVDQLIPAPDTEFTTAPLIYSRYYWRGRAFHDQSDTSNWSDVHSFRIDVTPPPVPVLIVPENESNISDTLPLFHWSRATGARQYAIQIAADSLFAALEDTANIDTTGYRARVGLADGSHWWRVRACDTAGNWSGYSVQWSFVIDTYIPTLLLPENNVNIFVAHPYFDWFDSRNVAGYYIMIATDSLFTAIFDSATVAASNFTPVDSLPDGVYYWRVKAYRSGGDTSGWSERWMTRVAAAVRQDSLVAWYPFLGSARDSSGNGHHGTISGAVTTTDRFGNANSAYQFYGLNNYILVPYSAALNPSNRITVAAWVKSTNADGVSFLSTEQNIPDRGYGLRVGGGQGVFYSSCGGNWISATAYFSNGPWYFMVGTFDGTAIRLYINGNIKESSAYNGLLTPSTADLRFGSKPDGSVLFTGAIDDVRIYNRSLKATEVQALYHEGGYTGVAGCPEIALPPAAIILLPSRPNPARNKTLLSYQLTQAGPIVLEVYNVAGQRVATLVNGMQSAGQHAIAWSLSNDKGSSVANGIYVVRLTAGTLTVTNKITVIH